MTKKVLKKIIKNNVEYWLPEGGGGGSDLNVNEVNSLIDLRTGDYEKLFQVESGLYKILNAIDDEDELGLSSGDTWADLVEDETSMNKISHCYTVMGVISGSDVALDGILNSDTALDEIMECYNSCFVLANNKKSFNKIINNENAWDYILNNDVAFDTFTNVDGFYLYLAGMSLTSSIWEDIFDNQILATNLLSSNDNLVALSKNHTAFGVLVNTSYWSSILNNYDKINIFMSDSYCSKYIIKNDTTAHLRTNAPMRSIINNNLLDDFLNKDYEAFNSIIVFDVNMKASNTHFYIANYGYNGGSWAWYYSVDGGNWVSTSGTTNGGTIDIGILSVGKHTVVIKPQTYGTGWARNIGTRDTNNRWGGTTTLANLEIFIRNIGLDAFSTYTDLNNTNYFLYYKFASCASLVGIGNIKLPDNLTSIGQYFMYLTFYNSPNLKTMGDNPFITSEITSVGTYFMYQAFQGCKLTKLPAGLDFGGITSQTSYVCCFTFQSNTALSGIPYGMRLPANGTANGYCQQMFYGCSNLSSNAPYENLYFPLASTNIFNSTKISTASPSAGANIPVHRS